MQWVVESYGLFLAALILVGGSLGDLFGRPPHIRGRSIDLCGRISSGLRGRFQYPSIDFARSIQGVGAALLVPGSLAIISASFDEKSRGQSDWHLVGIYSDHHGYWTGSWRMASRHASWRWVFFIDLPLAAAVIVISFWAVPEELAAGRGAGGLDQEQCWRRLD